MGSVFAHKACDVARVAVGPVSEVERNEHLEVELLSGCIRIVELLRRVAIDPRGSAVQSKAINANGLCLLDLVDPILNSKLFNDAYLNGFMSARFFRLSP